MTVTAINLPDTVSMALRVIAVQFGNGDDRKHKLTNAGYNPATVQASVNELLPILNKYGG